MCFYHTVIKIKIKLDQIIVNTKHKDKIACKNAEKKETKTKQSKMKKKKQKQI